MEGNMETPVLLVIFKDYHYADPFLQSLLRRDKNLNKVYVEPLSDSGVVPVS